MTDSVEASQHPEPAPGAWRRRLFRYVLLALCAAIVVLLSWPVVTGRTEAPVYARQSAKRALDLARKAGASRWAADALYAAESAFRRSDLECRIQENRLLPFRDFRAARALLEEAERKSNRAADTAREIREAARAEAERVLSEATPVVEGTEAIGDAMHLGTYDRVLLKKSSITLTEARYLFGQEEYAAAASRARDASEQAKRVSSRAVTQVARFTEPRLVKDWQRQVQDTIVWSSRTGSPAIVVLKENRRLDLYDDGRLVKSYRADMGYRSFNDKLRAGDAATPEGRYHITTKRGPGNATYYKAFDLDYPNADDRAQFERSKRAGRIPRGARLGGSIQIHGEGGRGKDWTRGCVAVSNGDMDDLFRRVGIGTPVTIVGSDGRGVFTDMVRQFGSTPATGTH